MSTTALVHDGRERSAPLTPATPGQHTAASILDAWRVLHFSQIRAGGNVVPVRRLSTRRAFPCPFHLLSFIPDDGDRLPS